jgi:protein-disulfide isomerase
MEKENKMLIPGAIVVAGILIAGAMFFGGGESNDSPDVGDEPDINFNEISNDDHILGNPDARIKVVEYSDIDCPFCSTFHQTMHQVIDEYGMDGDVAWVYRHFPIAQLHPDATRKAVASECVADLGDDTAFWNYLDILFERDESVGDLASIAAEVGVDSAEFTTCLNSGRFDSNVADDLADAQRAGGRGTPHSLIIVEGEMVGAIPGALPFDSVKAQIDNIISKL